MITALCYSPERGWSGVADLSTLSDLRGLSGNLVWAEVNVFDLTEDDTATIAEEFGLHPLAVEDAVNPRQRPKLEAYENHFFAVVHQLDTIESQLEAVQIACFIGLRFVLIVHAGADRVLEEARRRLSAASRDFHIGSVFLVHSLLDTVVDGYQAIADDLESEVERIEDVLLSTPNAPVATGLYSVKQRLARFRRYALPVGRILDEVEARGNFPGIPPELGTYFRDVRDHTLRIGEQVRNADDLANAAFELHRMHQNAELSEATKRLSGWAAIIAVPTFIASVYGMNFRLVPRDGSLEGFLFALSLMAITGIGLFLFFKRRQWL